MDQRESCLVGWIIWCYSCHVLEDDILHLPDKQLLYLYTTGHLKAGGGSSIMLWRIFSWASLGLLVVVKQIMKSADYLNVIMDQLLEIESSSRTTHLVTRLRLQWNGFRNIMINSKLLNQLPVPWLPNTSNLNPTGNDSSELKNPRISQICMTAAWTSGTICLRKPTKDLWHPCQGMLQLFCGYSYANVLLSKWS